MTPDPMLEPEGPEDERFLYVVTAAGVEVLGRCTRAAGERVTRRAADLARTT